MIGKTRAEHGGEGRLVSGPDLPSIEPLVIETGFGKRPAFVDLRKQTGREILRKLVAGADIFIDSYRPGTLAAKGFGAEDLASIRPGIVAVGISAFGRTGPWSARRGYDSLVQAAVGLAELNGKGGIGRAHV